MRNIRRLPIFVIMFLPLAVSACCGDSYGASEQPKPLTDSEIASFVGHDLATSLDRVPPGIAVASLDLSSVLHSAEVDPSGIEPVTIIAACAAKPIPQMKGQQIYFGTAASSATTPQVLRTARDGGYLTNLDC